MAGFIIAIISGVLMSVQGVFNTNVTKSSSMWVAAGFVQLTALLTCIVMWTFSGRPKLTAVLTVENKLYLLGGVLGAFITYTVVKSIAGLGVTKAELTIVVAQVAAAYLIELFGLFGSEKSQFSLTRFLSLLVAVGGVCMFYYTGKK